MPPALAPLGFIAVPIEQRIVTRAAGQDMHMDMRHCLPGKVSVSLREADSSRLWHMAGMHDLGDHRASIANGIWRHIRTPFNFRNRRGNVRLSGAA